MKPATAYFNTMILLMLFLAIGGMASGVADQGASVTGSGDGLEGLMVPGRLLGDTSGDGVPDVIRARMVVPADGTGLLAAAAVCERLGFESAGMDFDLVVEEARFRPSPDVFPVVIGRGNRWLAGEIASAVPAGVRALPSWAGLVRGRLDGREALFLFGSDPAAEAFAARCFFGRWPYLWEIWGRDSGRTHDTLRSEVAGFLKSQGISGIEPAIEAIWYENKGVLDRQAQDARDLAREMKGWRWDNGEISRLCLAVELNPSQRARVATAVGDLLRRRSEGQGTDVLNYPGVAFLELRLSGTDGDAVVEIPRFSAPARFLNRRFVPDDAPRFPRPVWLNDLYSLEGVFTDGNADRIPDDLPFQLAAAGEDLSPAVCHLAARLTLESTGARFPLVRLDTELPPPAQAGPLLVVGAGGLAGRAIRDLGLEVEPAPPGEAVIRAFNGKPLPCPVIWAFGADAAGSGRAAAYLARYHPYLGPDRSEVRSVPALREAVADWLAGRDPAAALAALLGEKTPLLRLLGASPAIHVKGTAWVDRPSDELRTRAGSYIARTSLPGSDIRVAARQEPKEVFSIRKELPWEWDLLRDGLRQFLDTQPAGAGIFLDVRVSEPAAARDRIAGEIRALAEGGAPGRVTGLRVLSAYKQGFSWLADDVAPRLRGRGVARVRVDFQSRPGGGPTAEKVYEEPMRWLAELYPIDEILARELGIRPEEVEFVQTAPDPGRPVYRVTALDGRGREILSEGFSPLVDERPFFLRFPSWGSAPVPQAGWLATRNGESAGRQAVDTDLARVWQVYQAEVLPALEKHVMLLTGNHPTTDKQPFFQRLSADVTASEPDESIGFQREHVSSLEAFHEDFYFLTLEYLNQMLDKSGAADAESVHYVRANPYGAPGTIVPYVRPGEYGKGPVAVFRLETAASEAPQLEFTWTTPEGVDHPEKVKLAKIEPESIHCEAIYVRETASANGARFRVTLKKDEDYDRFCRFFPSFRDVAGAGVPSRLAEFGLARLEFDVRSPGSRGMFTLNFPGADETAKRRNGEPATQETTTETQRTQRAAQVSDPKSEIRSPKSEVPNPQFLPPVPTIDVGQIVCPEECERLIGAFAGVPGFRVFRAGTSYEGRPVLAAEVLAPSASELLSRTKLLLHKPTLLLTGRQHANEVASTGYILKLMELLARDPVWQTYLQQVNLVLHPMENPDGAALACELQLLNPDHSLHAGRFTSLGVDLGYEVDRPRTLLTEALVRNRLYGRWLPDIYLNLHGYPSHEWVQQFSGYTPFLFRQYWIPKGWFAYFRYDDSGLSPDYARAGRTLMDYIRRGMEEVPEIASFDRASYARYRRWAVRWQPHIHYLDTVGETTLFHTRRSGTATRPGPRLQTTFAEGIPELMDETERGAFLAFLSQQGLAYVQAHLDYLSSAPAELVPIEEDKSSYTFFQLFRRRPPQVPEPPAKPDKARSAPPKSR